MHKAEIAQTRIVHREAFLRRNAKKDCTWYLIIDGFRQELSMRRNFGDKMDTKSDETLFKILVNKDSQPNQCEITTYFFHNL